MSMGDGSGTAVQLNVGFSIADAVAISRHIAANRTTAFPANMLIDWVEMRVNGVYIKIMDIYEVDY